VWFKLDQLYRLICQRWSDFQEAKTNNYLAFILISGAFDKKGQTGHSIQVN